ncbi:hypothetical protein [Gemmatimonas sp.]|uniref:hypothetical protein n=1 Tax=Gemmatimonas sp. TaxID=1962908 RepID=UPI003982EE10
MTRFRVFALFACVLVTACRFGTKPGEIDWVNSPEGARIAMRVNGESQDRVGELLAVGDEGVVMRGAQITRVSWSRVYAIDVDRLSGSYDLLRGEDASAPKRQRLALVSRFPQGLSAELLSQLLTVNKQTAVEEIR